MTQGVALRGFGKILKHVRDKYMHQVPTGPHTDVKKRELNPSFRNPNIESGRIKEAKRKSKVMGMGWKNVAKKMVGLKGGGKAK